jgi:hypothetical protein
VGVLVGQQLLGDGADERVLCGGDGMKEKGKNVRGEERERRVARDRPAPLFPQQKQNARGLGSVSREQTDSRTLDTVRAGDHCSLRTSCCAGGERKRGQGEGEEAKK